MYEIDLSIFNLINQSLANPLFDFIFPIITNEKVILPIYIILLLFAIWKGGRKGIILAFVLVLGAVLSDQISSHLLKQLVERPRPCHTLSDIRLLVGCGSGKSWPSSHAFNNATAAFLLSYFYPKYKYPAYIFASLVAFSRIYVGVHYPFDVLSGFTFGLILGWIICKLLQTAYIKEKINTFIR